MRRFIAIFIGFCLVGCVAETDPNVVDDVSDAVETTGSEASFFLLIGRTTGSTQDTDLSRVGVSKQAMGTERGVEVLRPPPTPLNEPTSLPWWPGKP